jgi:hypothetical protein
VSPVRRRRLGAAAPICLLLLAGTLAACGDDDDVSRGEDGRVEEAGDVSVFELLPGDCMTPPERVSTSVGTVRVVPCDEPHTQEVFALLEFGPLDDDADDFPGDDGVEAFAEAACIEPFVEYVEIDYVDSALFITFLLPTVRSWTEEGDREIVCIAQTAGEPLEESVEGSGR